MPLYLWPGYGHLPCAWERLLITPEKNPIVVVNPNSGPGDKFFDLFKNAVDKCQAAGIKVLGYVRTIYAKRSLAEIEQDLQLYKIWYNVDGFFIDEMYHWGESSFTCFRCNQQESVHTNTHRPGCALQMRLKSHFTCKSRLQPSKSCLHSQYLS